jgi:hypothetical protein
MIVKNEDRSTTQKQIPHFSSVGSSSCITNLFSWITCFGLITCEKVGRRPCTTGERGTAGASVDKTGVSDHDFETGDINVDVFPRLGVSRFGSLSTTEPALSLPGNGKGTGIGVLDGS